MASFNHQNNYICICGKEFTSSQAFNAHKSHCKEHFINKYGSEEKLNEVNKLRSTNAAQSLIINNIEKQKQAELIWIAEQHVCEHCGKIMTEKFGSGRFCSRACANARKHSNETKQKIANKVSKTKQSYSKKVTSFCTCKICGKKVQSSNKSGFCQYCLAHTDEGFKFLSEKSKASNKKAALLGKPIGWQSRNLISYPEQFWMQVLTNNNINYLHEVKVQRPDGFCYFLDFLIIKNDKFIDLEIDGEQHLKPERLLSDQKRDDFLKKDYLIYRIPWNEINSEKGKLLMKNKIDQFILFYNTV